jgi:predicted nucleic acid-binding protein
MILVDTGPLVALFDPKDGRHDRCVTALKEIRDQIITTTVACHPRRGSDSDEDHAAV